MRAQLYIAAGQIDPDKILGDFIGWAKLALILAIILGVIKGGRKHSDGDTKGAISTVVAVAVIAVAGAIALDPFGIGTSLLSIIQA